MNILKTKFQGLFVIELEPVEDARGYFLRTYCKEDFEKANIVANFTQSAVSFNRLKGTLRGMHFQQEPFAEEKLVRCVKGSIYDVVIDLRKSSGRFKSWFSIELSESNNKALYIPKGFAHGFQTLENSTEVFYQISGEYRPDKEAGIRWDDENFDIHWPLPVKCIAERDTSFMDYEEDGE